jgi:hypothetical protein
MNKDNRSTQSREEGSTKHRKAVESLTCKISYLFVFLETWKLNRSTERTMAMRDLPVVVDEGVPAFLSADPVEGL